MLCKYVITLRSKTHTPTPPSGPDRVFVSVSNVSGRVGMTTTDSVSRESRSPSSDARRVHTYNLI